MATLIKKLVGCILSLQDIIATNEYSGRILIKSLLVGIMTMLTLYSFMLYTSTTELTSLVAEIKYEYIDASKDDVVSIRKLVEKINTGQAIELDNDYIDITGADYIVWLNSQGRPLHYEPHSDVLHKSYIIPDNIDDGMQIRVVVDPIKPKTMAVEFTGKVKYPEPYGWLLIGVPVDFSHTFSNYTQVLDGNSVLIVNTANKNNLLIASNKITLHDYNIIVNDHSGLEIPLIGYRVGALSSGILLYRYETFMSGNIECKAVGIIRLHSDYAFFIFGILAGMVWGYLIFNRDINIRKITNKGDNNC